MHKGGIQIRKNLSVGFKIKLIFCVTVFLILFNVFVYTLDKIIEPTVLAEADSVMRGKVIETINSIAVKEYSKQFQYDEVIHVEKDEYGKIIMLRADTLKMNKIACDIALEAQAELKKLGHVGIQLPIGYITKNNILSNLGPKITVKMQPIGYIEAKYLSSFESAGVNQTRHKIYIQMITKMRVIIPTSNKDIEIKNEVPIAETIIVGETPNTAIQLDLQDAGFKLNSGGGNE